ncbi:MAG: cytochrome c biogenesis CcdA family protein [Anaerolineae bacterium]
MNLSQLNLVFAFTAGMLATVNPCGWAMLPAFISYYLGSSDEGYETEPLSSRALEGIKLGLLITAGFMVIFGGMAIIISAGLRVVIQFMPLLSLFIGALLVVLGIWLLGGKSLPIRIPQPQMDVSARNTKSIFMYGLAYGFASLSCTLPIFLAVVGASLTTAGVAGMTAMFVVYSLGMAVILMSVAMGTALFKGIVAQWFRKVLPYVHTVGAVMLIIAGVYLVWYQGRYLPLILAGFS